MSKLRFNEAKATQAAALLLKLRGAPMSYMKLIKLLYYVDREAFKRWGRSVSTAHCVSMKNGPVLSEVLDLINEGEQPGREQFWSTHISGPADYCVKLLANPGTDELSKAEEQLIGEVFLQHGHKNRWQIVDEIHRLPEWQDPGGSAIPISISEILCAVGKTPAEIAATEQELESLAIADVLLQV